MLGFGFEAGEVGAVDEDEEETLGDEEGRKGPWESCRCGGCVFVFEEESGQDGGVDEWCVAEEEDAEADEDPCAKRGSDHERDGWPRVRLVTPWRGLLGDIYLGRLM